MQPAGSAISDDRGEYRLYWLSPGEYYVSAIPNPRRNQLAADPEGTYAPLYFPGGIDAETAGPCAEAGATLLVAGTAIFGAPDPARAFAELASKIGCS